MASDDHGIMIDHVDRDLSAALRNGLVEMAIGENYAREGSEGYEHYVEINLTIVEVREFRDWLTSIVDQEGMAQMSDKPAPATDPHPADAPPTPANDPAPTRPDQMPDRPASPVGPASPSEPAHVIPGPLPH